MLPDAVTEETLVNKMSAVWLPAGTGGSNLTGDTVRVHAEGANLECMEIELQACLEGTTSAGLGREKAEVGIFGCAEDVTQDVVG